MEYGNTADSRVSPVGKTVVAVWGLNKVTDTKGNVTSTKVISNTTGDDALPAIAEREIKSAKFSPPIRNCVAKAFIFTYKRSF